MLTLSVGGGGGWGGGGAQISPNKPVYKGSGVARLSLSSDINYQSINQWPDRDQTQLRAPGWGQLYHCLLFSHVADGLYPKPRVAALDSR